MEPELKKKYKDNSGDPIIRHMLASVGQQPFQIGFDQVGGPPRANNIGEVTIELQSATNRKLTGAEIISIWRELTGPMAMSDVRVMRAEVMEAVRALMDSGEFKPSKSGEDLVT